MKSKSKNHDFKLNKRFSSWNQNSSLTSWNKNLEDPIGIKIHIIGTGNENLLPTKNSCPKVRMSSNAPKLMLKCQLSCNSYYICLRGATLMHVNHGKLWLLNNMDIEKSKMNQAKFQY
jgi:hypothetical protein